MLSTARNAWAISKVGIWRGLGREARDVISYTVMSSKKAETKRKAFKDWFDRSAAQAMASQMAGAMSGFDRRKFVRQATRDLQALEFTQRVQQFSDALRATLPESLPEALSVLVESLPPALPDCDSTTDGWLQWPLGQFIADHGLQHFDASMAAMVELTQRFSSEFAVRPFVEHYPEETFQRLRELTRHPSPHVRRWCSEGTRPRLPWGKKLRFLVSDPSPIWPILEALKDDEELYVRRSVANNLNDVAKDHPELVVARCKAWSRGASERRAWVIRHGLRTLIKKGDPGALAVVGYGPPRKLRAELSLSPKRIRVGGEVTLAAEIATTAARSQKLAVDYVVHYVRRNDKTSGKVFKWKTLTLPAGSTMALEKRHPMRKTTVRTLYPGLHRIELQVNGVRVAETSFQLAY